MSLFKKRQPVQAVAVVTEAPVRMRPTTGEIHAERIKEWERINSLPEWNPQGRCPACGCDEVGPRALATSFAYPPGGLRHFIWDLDLVRLAATCQACGHHWNCKPLNHAEQKPAEEPA